MLRRIAVGALSSCDLATGLLSAASVNRAGKDAPVPPRFIECLVHAKRTDAAANLAAAARSDIAARPGSTPIRQIWQMSQTLTRAGLATEANRWTDLALRLAEQPSKKDERENNTAERFANDMLKLEILRSADPARHDAFLGELKEEAKAFVTSRSFSATWAELRYRHALYADSTFGRSCVVPNSDLRIIATLISIADYYPEKNPSAMATVIFSLADRCRLEMYDDFVTRALRTVSGNNNTADRASHIARLAPFRSTMRQALATSNDAALPTYVLKGYVATIDRQRPSTNKPPEQAFVPVQYHPASSAPPAAAPQNNR